MNKYYIFKEGSIIGAKSTIEDAKQQLRELGELRKSAGWDVGFSGSGKKMIIQFGGESIVYKIEECF